jgi:hypothetical protein
MFQGTQGTSMIKALGALLLILTLAGCANVSFGLISPSDCSGGREASYSCQVDRYSRAGM